MSAHNNLINFNLNVATTHTLAHPSSKERLTYPALAKCDAERSTLHLIDTSIIILEFWKLLTMML